MLSFRRFAPPAAASLFLTLVAGSLTLTAPVSAADQEAESSSSDGTDQAKAPARALILFPMSGGLGFKARARLVRGLEKAGWAVAPRKEVSRAGLKVKSSKDDYERISKDFGVVAVVDGTARWRAGKHTLTLVVYDTSGQQVTEHTYADKAQWKLLGSVTKTAVPELVSDLEALRTKLAQPKPEPAPEPEPEKKEAPAPEPKAEPDKPEPGPEPTPAYTGAPTVEMELAGGLFTRTLRYNDDLFGALRPYDLGAAPAMGFRARFYPFALVTSGFFGNLGVGLSYSQILGTTSELADGRSFDTTARGAVFSLRYRQPIDIHQIDVELGGGLRDFTIDDTSEDSPLTPDVAYRFFRAGLGYRVRPSDFLIGVEGGYRLPLAFGELEEEFWFPNVSGGGLDAALLLGYRPAESVELVLSGRWERYFLSMNPEPSDSVGQVAGGAVDQIIAAELAVVVRLGKKASSP